MSDSNSKSWICLLCGYVHQGPEPPETCPVCGAPASEFKPVAEGPCAGGGKHEGVTASAWKCMVCGYVHAGDRPPDECPVCGAGAECFEPSEEVAVATVSSAAGEGGTIVIVGGGIAGLAAAEAIRENRPDARIVLVSREEPLPYYRLNLTRYLAGEVSGASLPLHPESWYEDKNIELIRGVEVSAIDTARRIAQLGRGEDLQYDKLILAAGAHPFVPPIPGAQREGVFSYRTIEDTEELLERAQSGARGIVVGGGILGLESAGALARHGVDVTVIEGYDWLMVRQLDRRGGERLHAHVEDLGIRVVTAGRVDEIEGDERVRAVRLADGSHHEADFVVTSAGIRPNSYLARRAGLEVGSGVIVDDHLVTSDEHILAAGDIAEHRGVVYGIWPASQFQGRIAGLNATGAGALFAGIPRSNTLKVLGIDVVSIGRVQADDGRYEEVAADSDEGYMRFLFSDNHMVGAIFVGDVALTAEAREAIENRSDFSKILHGGRPEASRVVDFLHEKSRRG